VNGRYNPLRDASTAHSPTSACACIRAHSPLTTPSPATAGAPPFPPHTIAVFHACSAQRGVRCCAVRGGCAEGRTDRRRSKVSQASTRRNTSPPAQFAPVCITSTPPQTNLAPNHACGALEGAQRRTCRSGTLCPSAPFGKPRPPAESPRTALSSQHCLMLSRRAFILN